MSPVFAVLGEKVAQETHLVTASPASGKNGETVSRRDAILLQSASHSVTSDGQNATLFL